MNETLEEPIRNDFALLHQAQSGGNGGDGKKSRVNRKHVIYCVTCAVIAAMVIAGILVGVKFYLDSTSLIVQVTHVVSFSNCEYAR